MFWTDKRLDLDSEDAAYSIPWWGKGLVLRNYSDNVRLADTLLK